MDEKYRLICQIYYLIQRTSLQIKSRLYDVQVYPNKWGISREDFAKMIPDFYNPDLRPHDEKQVYGSWIMCVPEIAYAENEPPIKLPAAPDVHRYMPKTISEKKEDAHVARLKDKGYGIGIAMRECEFSNARGNSEIAKQLIQNETEDVKNRDVSQVERHNFKYKGLKQGSEFVNVPFRVDMTPEASVIISVCHALGKSGSISEIETFMKVLLWVHIPISQKFKMLLIDVMPTYDGDFGTYIYMVATIARGMLEARTKVQDENFRWLWSLYETHTSPEERWMNCALGSAIVAADRVDLISSLAEHKLELRLYAAWARDNDAKSVLPHIAAPRFIGKILQELDTKRAMSIPIKT